MSMDYIRKFYKVPAERGGQILYNGWRGTIIGEHNSHLKIKMLSGYNRRVFFVHPLDEKLEYVEGEVKE